MSPIPDALHSVSKYVGSAVTFLTPPALLVPELLLHYFAHLSKKDLSVAALVCRFWGVLAEDTLWRVKEVPLTVLLKKLDENLHLGIRVWSLRRQLSPEQTDAPTHLRRYQKITSLHVDTCADGAAAIALRQLLNHYQESSLCPNLKYVSISISVIPLGSQTNLDSTLRFLLGSSTTEVTICDHNGTQELGMILRILGTHSPFVRSFTLGQCLRWGEIIGYTVDLGQLSHVKVLHLRDISIEAFETLCGCGELEELFITDGGYWGHVMEDEARRKMIIPSLRVLAIKCPRLNCPALVQTDLPSLRRLTFTYPETVSGASVGLQSVLEGLSQRSRLMEELTVEVCGERLGASAIHTLCMMKALTKIRLHGFVTGTLQITDDCIILLAQSFPNLTSLSVDVGADWETLAITDRSLVSVIIRCKDLDSLDIPLDLSRCHKQSTPRFLPSSSSVERLFIRHLKLSHDPTWTIRFLARRFPNARDFKLGGIGRNQSWLEFEDLAAYTALLAKSFHTFRGRPSALMVSSLIVEEVLGSR
ncbi:hypothetical protein FRB93_004229 [Tulasnella sp. JGI-2019a]|nr:hypothetical protein FRB93_004229 [Tulasnella sp. JGI-2019a]